MPSCIEAARYEVENSPLIGGEFDQLTSSQTFPTPRMSPQEIQIHPEKGNALRGAELFST